jgi:hypothetical protein
MEDTAMQAIEAERNAAAAARVPGTRSTARAGPGASIEPLISNLGDLRRSGAPDRDGLLGGLAIAGDRIYVAGGRAVDRLTEAGPESVVRLGDDSGPDEVSLTLAASPAGALYAAVPERGDVFRIDPIARSAVRVATGLAHPASLVALADGSLVVVEAAAGRLTLVGTDGALVGLAAGLSSPVGIAQLGGRFFVTEATGGRVVVVRPGNPPVPVASGFGTPVGVAVDRSGRLIVADAATGAVYRIESDSARRELASGFDLRHRTAGRSAAVPLVFAPSGQLLVVAPGDGSAWRITLP